MASHVASYLVYLEQEAHTLKVPPDVLVAEESLCLPAPDKLILCHSQEPLQLPCLFQPLTYDVMILREWGMTRISTKKLQMRTLGTDICVCFFISCLT